MRRDRDSNVQVSYRLHNAQASSDSIQGDLATRRDQAAVDRQSPDTGHNPATHVQRVDERRARYIQAAAREVHQICRDRSRAGECPAGDGHAAVER